MSTTPRKFKTPITVRHKCHTLLITNKKGNQQASTWFITLIPSTPYKDAHIEVRRKNSKITRQIPLDALIKQLTVPGAAIESGEGGK
jgi:hypothetical protein